MHPRTEVYRIKYLSEGKWIVTNFGGDEKVFFLFVHLSSLIIRKEIKLSENFVRGRELNLKKNLNRWSLRHLFFC